MGLPQQTFPLEELSTFPGNPRQGDVDAIAASLKKHGQYRTIVVNLGTHTGRPHEVLAGNHTFMAALQLGLDTIDATTVDVDDDMAKSIVAADNRTADKGGYDEQALLELLESLDSLEGTGYVDDDVQDLRDLLSNSDMWDRQGGGGGGDGHTDDDDKKFHPEIKLTVDPPLFERWRVWLDRQDGDDDVAKLRAALADVEVAPADSAAAAFGSTL